MKKWSRERYRMHARIHICSKCPSYKISCDTKKMCRRVENMIDDWMLDAELEDRDDD